MSTVVIGGAGQILMDNVGCYGWETRLIDCSHSRDTSEDTHDGDVAVQCVPGEFNCHTFVIRICRIINYCIP